MTDAVIIHFGAGAFAIVLAALSLFRRRRGLSEFLFVAGLLIFASQSVLDGAASRAADETQMTQWLSFSRLLACLAPGLWIPFTLTYARGNAGLFLKRWRWFLALALALPVTIALASRGNLIIYPPKALATDLWFFGLTPAGAALSILNLGSAIICLMNLEQTFRAALGTMRWRIKYMILGLGILFAVRVYTGSQVLALHRGFNSSLLIFESGGLLVGSLLMLRSLWREDADVVVFPDKPLPQQSFVLLAAGAYFLIVGVFAKVLEWIGATTGFQARAFLILLAVAAVCILALSDRVRLHTLRFVSRYFQRPVYDYRSVWRSFTEAMASQVADQEMCQAAIKTVAKIFEALSVSIWLVDEPGENLLFAASTSLSESEAASVAPTKEESLEVIRHFQQRPEPVVIESTAESWAETLRKGQPAVFRTGGDRVAVPLVSGGATLGVMILGDRVGGISFSFQDFDLLRCLGDQMAAALLNGQLSRRLLRAKEMEAFQTMSTFFVHDLKNLASTLNLMVKNLPIHFDNPAFREDALRGITKTGEHINHLISRLSLLRQTLQIQPVEADLNELIARVLAACPVVPDLELTRSLPPLPKIMIDIEQMDKVVTNLALNAIEAVGQGGRIHVETSHANGWIVLKVSDNGCGMDPDFMRRLLFRPFQTTKKKGLGIGMFQSKMIVDAHGGRIEAESERGQGSTFRVLLPMPKAVK